jgi:Uma2 family endonuclease
VLDRDGTRLANLRRVQAARQITSASSTAPCGRAAQAFFAHWVAQRGTGSGSGSGSGCARYQLVAGRVERLAPPGPRASAVAQRLHRRIALAAARAGARVTAPKQAIELPTGDTLVPDIAVFAGTPRRARRALGGSAAVLEAVTASRVPELVIDVLADSPARRDRVGAAERWRVLARAGVREHWIVDPRAGTVTVLVRRGDRLALRGVLRRDQAIDAEALLGMRLPVAMVV